MTDAKIAHAAIEIADSAGLAAVSMQAVSARLGYTTMSLYNHVASKDLLLELMFDVAAMPTTDDELDSPDWRDNVVNWAARVWDLYMRHPWSLQINVTHAPLGPGHLTRMEQLLTALEPSGLPPAETMSVAMNLLTMLRGMAQIAMQAGAAEDTDYYGADTAGLIDWSRFPRLVRVIEAEAAADAPATHAGLPADTHFGIQRILDGVTAHVAGR